MTSGIVRPTGSTNSGCTITGAATAHEAVDEVTLDTADYILFDSNYDYVYLTFPAVSGNANDTVVLEVDIIAKSVTSTSILQATLSDSAGNPFTSPVSLSITTTQAAFHVVAAILAGNKYAAGWKLKLVRNGSYNIMAYQVFARYKYCPTASLATVSLRPDADLTHGFLCSAGSTEWNLIDEETADDSDYIYDTASSLSKWSLSTPVHSGSLLYLKVTLRSKVSISGMTATNYIKVYDAAGNGLIYPGNVASIIFGSGGFTDWESFTPMVGGVKSTGELIEWADIDNAALEDNVAISGGTFYISYAEVIAYYEQVDYWDDSVPVVLPVVGYGFQVQVTLGANCPTLSKVQVQVSTDPAFATTDYDSGELDSTADALDVLSLIGSHTFSAAGTYYVRVGARNSTDTVMTWSLVGSFIVRFPSIVSTTVTHLDGPLYRITVVVSDDYADPPEVSVTIDGQTSLARLT